ncbi:hypothetical protein M3Y94_00229400 [Aphelenchoides besseyi]|nr:hypothetical protein M3Y94_00229400 [Aphelenchoides besseyi]KAI6236454.1 hypothetical protein M3Y95_00159400 [Aphelenchoides besseyi]
MADEDMERSSSSLSTSSIPSILPGANWDSFFNQFDANIVLDCENGTSNGNEFASKMPYQKATCFGVSPLDNARYLKLVKCNLCGRVIKHVGYAHHMRRRHHGHAPELNGFGSGDEVPDFLLSPPHYATSGRTSPIKPQATNANSMSYIAEQRDGLLLVLKRTKTPTINDKHVPSESSVSSKEASMERIETKTPTKPQQNGRRSLQAKRQTPRIRQPSTSAITRSVDSDCVALRTRKRHPETEYVELPAVTRTHKTSTSPNKTIVIRALKDSHDIGLEARRRTSDLLPANGRSKVLKRPSIFVVDEHSHDRSSTLDDHSEQNSSAVEFISTPSPMLPSNEAELDCPPSSQSSSTQSSLILPSKSSDLLQTDETNFAITNSVDESTRRSIESNQADNEEEEMGDAESERSTSPEMPQLERQDIYDPIDDSSDGIEMNNTGGFNNTTNLQFAFPSASTVVYCIPQQQMTTLRFPYAYATPTMLQQSTGSRSRTCLLTTDNKTESSSTCVTNSRTSPSSSSLTEEWSASNSSLRNDEYLNFSGPPFKASRIGRLNRLRNWITVNVPVDVSEKS